jgi:hypothetical protein
LCAHIPANLMASSSGRTANDCPDSWYAVAKAT